MPPRRTPNTRNNNVTLRPRRSDPRGNRVQRRHHPPPSQGRHTRTTRRGTRRNTNDHLLPSRHKHGDQYRRQDDQSEGPPKIHTTMCSAISVQPIDFASPLSESELIALDYTPTDYDAPQTISVTTLSTLRYDAHLAPIAIDFSQFSEVESLFPTYSTVRLSPF